MAKSNTRDQHALEYGVLLPHFGSQAMPTRLLNAGRLIEDYAFDSVWVRDHVVFHPHPYEDPNHTHIEPFVLLSAVASTTSRLVLGMATLIPHRNPIHTALLAGSLAFLAGPGRIILGFGIGANDDEFEAIGIGNWDRRRLIREQVAVMRQLWKESDVSFSGEFYKFKGVTIEPKPLDGNLPIWYGGNSPAAVRRAVEYCDGWLPGRMGRTVFRERMNRMKRLAEERGRPLPQTGVIPWVVPAKNSEQGIPAEESHRLLKELNEHSQVKPPGGYQSLEDSDGAIIIGPLDKIIEEIRLHQQEGVQHFIFDMRARFDRWEESVAILGEEVLPELHRGDGRTV